MGIIKRIIMNKDSFKFIICSFFMLVSLHSVLYSQSPGQLSGIRFFGNNEIYTDGVSKISSKKITYAEIQGSPFLYDSFFPSDVFDTQNRKVGRFMIRYNLATQELHFLNNDSIELVISDPISKIVMFSKNITVDSAEIFLKMGYDFLSLSDQLKGLVQQMNNGKYSLYKFTKKSVIFVDSPLEAAQRNYFRSASLYFLKTPTMLIHLKKLSSDQIMSNLDSSNLIEKWIKENNLKLNKEEDVVKCLDYYNSLLK